MERKAMPTHPTADRVQTCRKRSSQGTAAGAHEDAMLPTASAGLDAE